MAMKTRPMGKVPSFGGSPSTQAMTGAMTGKAMPMRSPGKPAKTIVGKPSSVAIGKSAKQPKGKAPPSLKRGNIKGIKKGSVANVKGGSQGRM